MHLRKLISDFHITINLFFFFLECLGLNFSFHKIPLTIKISKGTITHVFHLKLHQRQTSRLHFILAVCHFLK